MKKLFFIIGLFFSLSAMAQPTNYTKINMRYRWLSGMFDSALYVPRYNGTPSGVRVNETSVFDGMVAMDTTNNRLYIYSGGAWVRLANYSEIAAYTAGNGLTLSGSQFKLGSPLTEPTTITGDATNKLVLQGYNASNDGYLNIGQDAGYLQFGSGAFTPSYESEIYSGSLELGLRTSGNIYLEAGDIYTIGVPTVSSTTGRKVALIDTVTGKVERIDPASLNTNIYNSDGILTGNRVLKGGLNQLRLDSLSYLLINAGYDGAIPNSLLELSDASATLEYKDNNGVLKARIFGSADGGNMYSFTDDGVGGNVIEQVEGEMSMRTFYYGNLTEIAMYADSLSIRPNSGIANIDSLRTWSGISDTTHKKPMTWDTRNGRWEYAANWPQQKISLVFGAGSGADSDTTAFTTSAIYGSFYNDADTIVVTSMRSVLQGTSPDVAYKVWYNDSLNVEAGATALVTAGSQVTNTTTGTNVTSFDVTKIPPGVWVWVKTSTVATKPKYFSLTVNGYRK